MRRVPGVARVAEDVVVPDRPVGEFGELQRGNLMTASRLKPFDQGAVLRGGLFGADISTPTCNLADSLEHVLVRERDTMQRPERFAVCQRLIRSARRRQRLVIFENDHRVTLLVRCFEPDEGGLRRFDRGNFARLDLSRQIDGCELV